MSQERKVPKSYIIRTVKSIISAAFQKVVENMELFTHKIRTIKGEPQMKFCKIQDTLNTFFQKETQLVYSWKM